MKVSAHNVGEVIIAMNQVPSVEQAKLQLGQIQNFVKLGFIVLRALIIHVPKTAALVFIAKRVAQVHVHVHVEHQEICRHKLRAEHNAFHAHQDTIVHLKILAMILKYENFLVLMVMYVFKAKLQDNISYIIYGPCNMVFLNCKNQMTGIT